MQDSININNNKSILAECTEKVLDDYFNSLGDIDRIDDLFSQIIEEVERPIIEKVMNITGGRKSNSAKILGISRNTLNNKIKKYNL